MIGVVGLDEETPLPLRVDDDRRRRVAARARERGEDRVQIMAIDLQGYAPSTPLIGSGDRASHRGYSRLLSSRCGRRYM